MANFMMPTFEETHFICRACGHMFQGRDCEKGQLEKIARRQYPLPPYGLLGPKCPECGSRNTEKDMFVCY